MAGSGNGITTGWQVAWAADTGAALGGGVAAPAASTAAWAVATAKVIREGGRQGIFVGVPTTGLNTRRSRDYHIQGGIIMEIGEIKPQTWQLIAVAIIVTTLITLVTLYVWAASLVEQEEYGPVLSMESTENDDGSYTLTMTHISRDHPLDIFQYFLKDDGGLTKQFGEIALQNISGRWHGIDVTWNDSGTGGAFLGDRRAVRPDSAGGPYGDPFQAQARIDDVLNGSQSDREYQKSDGTISVSFHDNDFDGNLTVGDQFIVLGNSHPNADHKADGCWRFEPKHGMGDTIGSFRLGECGGE